MLIHCSQPVGNSLLPPKGTGTTDQQTQTIRIFDPSTNYSSKDYIIYKTSHFIWMSQIKLTQLCMDQKSGWEQLPNNSVKVICLHLYQINYHLNHINYSVNTVFLLAMWSRMIHENTYALIHDFFHALYKMPVGNIKTFNART